MNKKNRTKELLKDISRPTPKMKYKPKDDPFVPDPNELAQLMEQKENLFDTLKFANLRKREVSSRYKHILERMIPKINSANRNSRRTAAWLKIKTIKIEFDENGRTTVRLRGEKTDSDKYMDALSEDSYDKELLFRLKKDLDISVLIVASKNNYNEYEIDL